MAGSLNKVILIGNTGKDPETKTFDGGRTLVRLPLATSETYKNQNGEKVTQTEWHSLQLWGRVGEIAERYVKKGDKIMVEGQIKTRSWETDSGEKRYSTEIQVRNLVMLGSPGGAQDNPRPAEPEILDPVNMAGDDDDLPF